MDGLPNIASRVDVARVGNGRPLSCLQQLRTGCALHGIVVDNLPVIRTAAERAMVP